MSFDKCSFDINLSTSIDTNVLRIKTNLHLDMPKKTWHHTRCFKQLIQYIVISSRYFYQNQLFLYSLQTKIVKFVMHWFCEASFEESSLWV